MERAISDEEKIRRAIEISQRRNQNYYSRETARVNVNNKKNYKLFKKMVLQIIICFLIYFIFYLISTTNYAFSDQVIESTNSILNYDINIEKIYKDCEKFFVSIFKNNENNKTNNTVENSVTNNSINVIANAIETSLIDNKLIENNAIEVKEEEKKEEKTEMEQDAEKVKELCRFQKPLSGVITSEFGEREVTLKGMTANHKGIDIAAKSGTSIKAAMTGTVTVAEENSEYGKFIKIEKGDVMTVYAHCKSLKVKKGDKVKIGQTIATVGSTGHSTGPHLHFEIRLSGRYINPKLIIKL